MPATEITELLLRRYPLLSKLHAYSCDGKYSPEPLPTYYGLFLSAIASRQQSPLCFILPRRGETARLVAIIHALSEFLAKQDQLIMNIGYSSFQTGDVVRLHPGRHVFRYGGFDEEAPHCIWFATLDGKGRIRSPAKTILPRLERTTLQRPVGRLTMSLLNPVPSPWDTVLGSSTFGNQSLMQNEVIVLDSQGAFKEFISTTTFQLDNLVAEVGPFKDVIPFGELSLPSTTRKDWFYKWDERNPTGEPLVILCHSPELLAEYSMANPSASKLVIVNGLSRIKNLQVFDDIRQTNRLILFADHDEHDMIEALNARGCRFWQLGSTELQMVTTASTPEAPGEIIGNMYQWNRNYTSFKLDYVSCSDRTLEEIYLLLKTLDRKTDLDREGPMGRLLGRIWHLFLDASSAIRPPSEETRTAALSRIEVLRNDIQRNIAWFSPEVKASLENIVKLLGDCFGPGSEVGLSKGQSLRDALGKSSKSNVHLGILVRKEIHVEHVRNSLSEWRIGDKRDVFSPSTIPEDEFFDQLVCLAWPGGDQMRRMASLLTTPRITIVGYPFEQVWARQCHGQIHRRHALNEITDKEKASISFGKESESLPWTGPTKEEPEQPSKPAITDFDIWRFESRLRAMRKGAASNPAPEDAVPAKYVSFTGASYAFLTEGHKVPVATELLSGPARQGKRLPERMVADIRQGDFLVFPISGEREVIQDAADSLLGSKAQELRKMARIWKESLQTSGIKPDTLLEYARNEGRPRHIATIRNWFAATSQIGPGNGIEDLKPDLRLIARATNSRTLEENIDKVCEAIRQLRSAHLSAGMRLKDILLQRLPEVMGKVEENGTKVDLAELGSAWIVQLDSIGKDFEERARSEVNRLLWDDEESNMGVLL